MPECPTDHLYSWFAPLLTPKDWGEGRKLLFSLLCWSFFMNFSDLPFLVWSPGYFGTKFWFVSWVVLAHSAKSTQLTNQLFMSKCPGDKNRKSQALKTIKKDQQSSEIRDLKKCGHYLPLPPGSLGVKALNTKLNFDAFNLKLKIYI